MEKQSLGFSNISQNKKGTPIIINDSYLVKQAVFAQNTYRLCKAIDLSTYSFVNVYFRLISSENNNYVVGIKEELKNKICPSIKWKGNQKIGKVTYDIEVHEKYGPSLHQIFANLKFVPSSETICLLCFQMIKIVQKMALSGYVCHNLTPHTFVLSSDLDKTDLFLLNDFDVKKKNEDCNILSGKYASIGAHLGLKASFKDDLESICYILFDLCLNNTFFQGVHEKSLIQFKNTLKIANYDKVPKIILDLFIYARNLNHVDEVNFSHWKTILKAKISKNYFNQPYEWVTRAKAKSKITKYTQNSQQQDIKVKPNKSQFYQSQTANRQSDEVQQQPGQQANIENEEKSENGSNDYLDEFSEEQKVEVKVLKFSSEGWKGKINV